MNTKTLNKIKFTIGFVSFVGCIAMWVLICTRFVFFNNKQDIVEYAVRGNIIERQYVYSNQTYVIRYDEYSNNALPYVFNPGTNNIGLIRIRNAVITVFELVDGISNQVRASFRGISIKSSGWDETSDKFYIEKALTYTEP